MQPKLPSLKDSYSLQKMNSYKQELDHVLNAVAAAEYSNEPYEHCYIKNIFSDDVYEEILNILPSDDEYYFMKHPELKEYGTQSPRLRLELDSTYQETLSKDHILNIVLKVLHSKELKGSMFNKFKATLECVLPTLDLL